MQNNRYCPVLDSSTESMHLDATPQDCLQVHDPGAPIVVPRQTFREWEGEARRVQERTLYGVVGVQASETQFSLICLVVVLPIFAKEAVYR
jgi:hypothetical protein